MNAGLYPSARSIFQHQLAYGNRTQKECETLRRERKYDAVRIIAGASALPIWGAAALTVVTGGAALPALAIPVALAASGATRVLNKDIHSARDVPLASNVDFSFGALAWFSYDERKDLIAHLVQYNVVARPPQKLDIEVYYLCDTHNLKAILNEYAPFRHLPLSSQGEIITYLVQAHQMGPMVRVVRDLEAKLAKAIAEKDAVATGVLSTKLTDFQQAIEGQLTAMDRDAEAAAYEQGADLAGAALGEQVADLISF